MEKKLNIFNLNLKRLNLSAWLTVLSLYVLPYKVAEDGGKLFGYPFTYLQFHSWTDTKIPLMFLGVQVAIFAIDILIIYFVLTGLEKIFMKRKNAN